ncbi:MAG: PEGA domain-containing protein [Acidobacteriaceae bacterium]
MPFEVVEEVDVDGVPVITKGAAAIGTVTEAQEKRRMGRAGKLNINISYVRLRDNEKAMLRAVKDANGQGHVGAMTGAIVATSIVFFPAAPLFLFMHGKDITIPQGTEITAFTQGDMHLNMAQFQGTGASPEPAMASAAPANCSLIVESTPPGADINIDGAFVGNTPSTVNVSPGSHEIVVKKQGFADWTRKLNVTGGSVHLDATLSPSTGN